MPKNFVETLRKLAQSNSMFGGAPESLMASIGNFMNNRTPIFQGNQQPKPATVAGRAQSAFGESDSEYAARQKRLINNPYMSADWRRQQSKAQNVPLTTPTQHVKLDPVHITGKVPESAEPPLVFPKKPAMASSGKRDWSGAAKAFKSLGGNSGISSLSQAVAQRNKLQKGTPEYNKIQGLINQSYGLKTADLNLDIDEGDILLGGKFKNSPMEVKEFGTDDIGQPTVNGKKLLAHRINKEMPEDRQYKGKKEGQLFMEENTMQQQSRLTNLFRKAATLEKVAASSPANSKMLWALLASGMAWPAIMSLMKKEDKFERANNGLGYSGPEGEAIDSYHKFLKDEGRNTAEADEKMNMYSQMASKPHLKQMLNTSMPEFKDVVNSPRSDASDLSWNYDLEHARNLLGQEAAEDNTAMSNSFLSNVDRAFSPRDVPSYVNEYMKNSN